MFDLETDRKRQKTSLGLPSGKVNFSTLEVNQELNYQPSTRETRAAYEQILHIIRRHLGDCSLEVLKDTVDEVLLALKDDSKNDR